MTREERELIADSCEDIANLAVNATDGKGRS